MGASKDLDLTLNPQSNRALMLEYDKAQLEYPEESLTEWATGVNYDWQAARDAFRSASANLRHSQVFLSLAESYLLHGSKWDARARDIILGQLGTLSTQIRSLQGYLTEEGPASEPEEPKDAEQQHTFRNPG